MLSEQFISRAFFDAGVWFHLWEITELLINFPARLPRRVYLIWTVFISSTPDASEQPSTMRSLLDI